MVLLTLTSVVATSFDRAAPARGMSVTDMTQSEVQRAAQSGERVEILGKRTESSQTFANPDGTFTLEQSAVPVRKRRDGLWVDLDPTLARGADGLIRPAATAMEMEFSNGGARPLATLRYDGKELRLRWPSVLPTPAIDGDSLTYPNVYPDVDLKVNVTRESFSEVLVVRTPAAARNPQVQRIAIGLEAPGLILRKSSGGGIEGIDDLGRAVFTAPKPAMWDSRGDGLAEPPSDRTEAPLEGDRVVSMPVEVSQQQLVLQTPSTLLDDPASVYPLHVDPWFTANRSGRSMIDQHYPSNAYWGWSGDEGVGYQAFEPWGRKRLFFSFNIGGVAGADIRGATFSAFETWAASCTPKVVEVWKTAKFTENTNWTAGSGSSVWQQRLSYATVAHGRDGCEPGGYLVPFNVTDAVADQAAARNGYVYLGMRAQDESDQYAWKRFRYDVQLSIIYNNPPSVSGPHTTDPYTKCVTSTTGYPVIGENTPIPTVTITDPDTAKGNQVKAEFEMRRVGDVNPFWTSDSTTKLGGSAVYFSPSSSVPHLSNNTAYAWRARAFDGTSYSPWLTSCYLLVDTTKPPSPTVDVITTPPWTIGKSLQVRFGPNGAADVTGYRYAINDDAPWATVISASSPTITTTPSVFGPYVISAWSVDRAGNTSGTAGRREIRVADGDPIGTWLMNEASGSVLGDESAAHHSLSLTAGTSWGYGERWQDDPSDWAVVTDGSGGTAPSSATDIVNSAANFGVTANVRLATKSTRQVAVSEDRSGTSGFTLGALSHDLVNNTVVWAFTVVTTEGNEVVVKSEVTPYNPGDWVHLSGSYIESSHRIELYVDTVLVATTEVSGSGGLTLNTTDGTGSFRIGRAIAGGVADYYWRGHIEDVNIFNGALSLDKVQALCSS